MCFIRTTPPWFWWALDSQPHDRGPTKKVTRDDLYLLSRSLICLSPCHVYSKLLANVTMFINGVFSKSKKQTTEIDSSMLHILIGFMSSCYANDIFLSLPLMLPLEMFFLGSCICWTEVRSDCNCRVNPSASRYLFYNWGFPGPPITLDYLEIICPAVFGNIINPFVWNKQTLPHTLP